MLPYGRHFSSSCGGLQPLAATLRPFGPSQTFWKSVWEILRKSIWIFFGKSVRNILRKSVWTILWKSIWNVLLISINKFLRKSFWKFCRNRVGTFKIKCLIFTELLKATICWVNMVKAGGPIQQGLANIVWWIWILLCTLCEGQAYRPVGRNVRHGHYWNADLLTFYPYFW